MLKSASTALSFPSNIWPPWPDIYRRKWKLILLKLKSCWKIRPSLTVLEPTCRLGNGKKTIMFFIRFGLTSFYYAHGWWRNTSERTTDLLHEYLVLWGRLIPSSKTNVIFTKKITTCRVSLQKSGITRENCILFNDLILGMTS